MELEQIEKDVREYIFNRTDITISEQAERIPVILDLIVSIYNKYTEELTPEEAYTILYGEQDEHIH